MFGIQYVLIQNFNSAKINISLFYSEKKELPIIVENINTYVHVIIYFNILNRKI